MAHEQRFKQECGGANGSMARAASRPFAPSNHDKKRGTLMPPNQRLQLTGRASSVDVAALSLPLRSHDRTGK